MTPPKPAITLDVDLTNPGQFLACCGLLELASRLDPEAVAWFDGSRFHLALKDRQLLDHLLACDVKPLVGPAGDGEMDDDKSPPVQFAAPLGCVLDWWKDKSAERAGFKTWAGGQTVMGFITGMRGHVAGHGQPLDQFFAALPIGKPKPFYFDSRISRLTSLDMGFSAEGFTTAFSPAVELLALVGMQRFRPQTIVERERYAYSTWTEPLVAPIAAAVAHGLIASLVAQRYVFPLVVRTGGKYKAFGPAILERNSHA